MTTGQTKLDEPVGSTGYGDLEEESMMGPGVWLHVPDRTESRMVLMIELPYRYMGHWIRGKIRPCPGPSTCDWCAQLIGRKPRYGFAMYDCEQRRCGVLEVGPEAAAMIRDGALTSAGGVGTCYKLRKKGGVRNGQLQVTVHHTLYKLHDLPRPLDPEDVYKRMWSMPERER